MITTQIRTFRVDGTPVISYTVVPGVPAISVMKIDRTVTAELEDDHAHAHDFPLLCYFERGGGSLRNGNQEWTVETGDVYIVAPGEIVGTRNARGLQDAEGWGVFFSPEMLGFHEPGTFLPWRTHPLLFPFVRSASGGIKRLKVPTEIRPLWSERLRALDLELNQRRDGYHDAALALLTLMVVDVGRLAADVVGELKLQGEPLLAEVFDFIESHYQQSISLRDVAWALNLTPGHLTTVVRQKTGKTVQEWITERRMAQARRLLVEEDRTVEEVGRQVGYSDPSYFIRTFRRVHGATPLTWRRAGRR